MNKKQRTLFYIASIAVLFAIVSFILSGLILGGVIGGSWYETLTYGVIALCLGGLIMKD